MDAASWAPLLPWHPGVPRHDRCPWRREGHSVAWWGLPRRRRRCSGGAGVGAGLHKGGGETDTHTQLVTREIGRVTKFNQTSFLFCNVLRYKCAAGYKTLLNFTVFHSNNEWQVLIRIMNVDSSSVKSCFA